MVDLRRCISKDLPKQEGKPMQAIKLNEADAILLVKALTRPSTLNEKLKAAAIRYESKVQ